jgi:hypothetical protein
MSSQDTLSQQSAESDGLLENQGPFVQEYGRSIAAIFVALVVAHLPVVNLINVVPLFKEVVLGAAVVAIFTPLSEVTEGAKHALVAGMIAAVVFNVIYIPASFVIGGSLAASGGQAAGSAMASGLLAGLGAFVNLVGLIFFSPIGYAIGGVLGSVLN